MFDRNFDRKSALCASEAAAVFNVATHGGPRAVWLEKSGAITHDDEGSEYSVAGNLYEALIIDAAAEALAPFGVTIDERDLTTTRAKHAPWLAATPDARGHDAAGLVGVEVKTVWSAKSKATWEAGASPLGYRMQTLHQQAVLCWPRWFLVGAIMEAKHPSEVVGMVPAFRIEVREVTEPKALRDRYAAITGRWWMRHVVEGTEPMPSPWRRGERSGLNPADVVERFRAYLVGNGDLDEISSIRADWLLA